MNKRHKHADFIIAWANGAEIERKNACGEWEPEVYTPTWENWREYRIKPHKFQDVIDAYLRGETVQYYTKTGWMAGWLDLAKGRTLVVFDSGHEYRIKPEFRLCEPEPKPDIRARLWSQRPIGKFYLTFVFDGETKEFKTVEYHDE